MTDPWLVASTRCPECGAARGVYCATADGSSHVARILQGK